MNEWKTSHNISIVCLAPTKFRLPPFIRQEKNQLMVWWAYVYWNLSGFQYMARSKKLLIGLAKHTIQTVWSHSSSFLRLSLSEWIPIKLGKAFCLIFWDGLRLAESMPRREDGLRWRAVPSSRQFSPFEAIYPPKTCLSLVALRHYRPTKFTKGLKPQNHVYFIFKTQG